MKSFLTGITMGWSEIQKLLFHKSSGDPSGVVDAGVWYDTATNQFKGRRNGSSKNFLMTGDAAAPTLSNEKYDFFSNSAYTIINDDVADTLITDTTKPASPQYTRTLTGGDIPSNEFVTDWMVVVQIAGRNTDSSTRTINWRFTLNGTDIGSADNSLSPTTTNSYWRACGAFALSAISAGDVIGVKLWASVGSVVDYRIVSLIIIPRKYKSSSSALAIFHYIGGANAPNGTLTPTFTGYSSNSTVTYSAQHFTHNGVLTSMINSGTYIAGNNYVVVCNANSDNNNVASGITSSAVFFSVATWQYISVFRYT